MMSGGDARIIAVGNLKGGVGKSTVAVNLACALAADGGDGRAAAIVDTDPQATATHWVTGGRTPALCHSMPVEDFDGAGEWLRDLDGLCERHGALVVDLPAVLSPALAAAFMVADLILIPTSDSEVDMIATARTLRFVHLARQARREDPPRVLVVPSGLLPRPRPWWGGGGWSPFPRFGERVGPPLHRLPEHPAAFAVGDWVGGRAPGSVAHKEVLALKAAAVALLAAPAAAPGGAGDDDGTRQAATGGAAGAEGSRLSRFWRRCTAVL